MPENAVKPVAYKGARRLAALVVEAGWFTPFITFVIIANAITLGMGTYGGWPPAVEAMFEVVDSVASTVFIVEIGLELITYRFSFFKSGWNVFDIVIVTISVIPGTGPFNILRAMRVMRVLRLLSVVPMMRRIVEALFQAIPGMGAILAVLALMVYVAAVMATSMYGVTNPELFGSLPVSALTLFQVMTMDGWRGEILQPVMEAGHPYAWVFFLIYIVLASFAVLNLFIALVVEALNDDFREDVTKLETTTHQIEEGQEEAHIVQELMLSEVRMLREEIAELRTTLREQEAQQVEIDQSDQSSEQNDGVASKVR